MYFKHKLQISVWTEILEFCIQTSLFYQKEIVLFYEKSLHLTVHHFMTRATYNNN